MLAVNSVMTFTPTEESTSTNYVVRDHFVVCDVDSDWPFKAEHANPKRVSEMVAFRSVPREFLLGEIFVLLVSVPHEHTPADEWIVPLADLTEGLEGVWVPKREEQGELSYVR